MNEATTSPPTYPIKTVNRPVEHGPNCRYWCDNNCHCDGLGCSEAARYVRGALGKGVGVARCLLDGEPMIELAIHSAPTVETSREHQTSADASRGTNLTGTSARAVAQPRRPHRLTHERARVPTALAQRPQRREHRSRDTRRSARSQCLRWITRAAPAGLSPLGSPRK